MNSTFTAGDVLDGGDGNDTLILDNQGNVIAGMQTVKNIENLKVYESTLWTGDVSQFEGLKNVAVTASGAIELTAGDSVTDVSLVGGAAAAANVLTGDGITNVSLQNVKGSLTVTNGTAGHTLNVALDRVGVTAASSTIKDATAETIALTSNGKANFVTLDGNSLALKNITIAGAGDLTMDASAAVATTIDGSKATGNLALGTLNATTIKTGTGDDTFTTGAVASKVMTIDTGAGDDDVTLAATAALGAKSTISLGDGDDTLTMDFAALTANLTIDGGKGDLDALIFNKAADFTADATKYALVKDKGFEVMGVDGATLTADASLLGVTQFYAEKTGALILTNMATDSTVTLSDGTSTTSVFTMKDANSTINLNLVNDDNVANAASVTTTQASIINVNSELLEGSTDTGANALKLTAQANATVTITGDHDLTYTNNVAVDQVIKAGDFTGNLNVTGNTGIDTITVGSGGSTVTGGAGNDVITLGAGVDTVVFSAAATNGIDAITGFTAGVGKDVLDVSGAAGTLTGIIGGSAGTAITAGSIANLTIASGGSGATLDGKLFVYEGTQVALAGMIDTTAAAGKHGLADGAVAMVLIRDNATDTTYDIYAITGANSADTFTQVGTVGVDGALNFANFDITV